MALTFTQTKSTLDQIATRSESARRNLDRARELIAAANAELDSMSTDYSGFVTELNQIAQTQNDPAWDTAKAEKDLMVADFNGLKSRASNLLSAYDSVGA